MILYKINIHQLQSQNGNALLNNIREKDIKHIIRMGIPHHDTKNGNIQVKRSVKKDYTFSSAG